MFKSELQRVVFFTITSLSAAALSSCHPIHVDSATPVTAPDNLPDGSKLPLIRPLHSKSVSAFQDATQGQFAATGLASGTQPDLTSRSCMQTVGESQGGTQSPHYDPLLKVGQKFVDEADIPSKANLLTLTTTRVLTAVSATHLESHVIQDLNDTKMEHDEVCDMIYRSNLKTTLSECKAKGQKDPAPIATPSSGAKHIVRCDIDTNDADTKTSTTWSEGEYTFANGNKIKAWKEVTKTTGTYKCVKDGESSGDPIPATIYSVRIVSNDVLDLDHGSSCAPKVIYNYMETRDSAGKLINGLKSEKIEAPTENLIVETAPSAAPGANSQPVTIPNPDPNPASNSNPDDLPPIEPDNSPTQSQQHR